MHFLSFHLRFVLRGSTYQAVSFAPKIITARLMIVIFFYCWRKVVIYLVNYFAFHKYMCSLVFQFVTQLANSITFMHLFQNISTHIISCIISHILSTLYFIVYHFAMHCTVQGFPQGLAGWMGHKKTKQLMLTYLNMK